MAEHRAALDVEFPSDAGPLVDFVDALLDDFRPFAIEQIAAGRRRVHFFTIDDRVSAGRAIATRFGPAGIVVRSVDLEDDGAAWAARTQADLRAVCIGRLNVAPPWDVPPATPDTVTVVIQPSMGFGTGHHASTRLCLRALQNQLVHGHSVTDLGAGSGVLAIAAAKLGATPVVAIESDQDSAGAARENIERNGVGTIVTLLRADFQDVPSRPRARIILANLTGAPLCTLARTVTAWAEPDGILILSGFVLDEEASILHAYHRYAALRDRRQEGEWACVVLQARGHSL